MESYTQQHQSRGIAPERMTPSELKRMIVKLRWIGLEHEADRLGTLLEHHGHCSSVLATPRETD